MNHSQGNFSDYLIEIANHYGLEKWDWFAICIAFISLLVAGFTLLSQIKTQRNTAPAFTKSSQKLVITNITYNILSSFGELAAIWLFLDQKKFKGHFLKRVLKEFQISTDQLHLEITYDNDDNYMAFAELKKDLERYNSLLEDFQEICEDNDIEGSIISSELSHIYYFLNHIIVSTIKLYRGTFKDKKTADDIMQSFANYKGIKNGYNVPRRRYGKYEQVINMNMLELHNFTLDNEAFIEKYDSEFVTRYKSIREFIKDNCVLSHDIYQENYSNELEFIRDIIYTYEEEYISCLAYFGTLYSMAGLSYKVYREN